MRCFTQRISGICKRVFLEAVEAGEIKSIKRNGRLWFREQYLIEFIEKMEKEAVRLSQKTQSPLRLQIQDMASNP